VCGPAPTESAIEPLHSVGDSAAVEEFAIEALHSTVDPAAAESAVEPLQSIVDSEDATDAPTETSCS
jgi:hypothetical protein